MYQAAGRAWALADAILIQRRYRGREKVPVWVDVGSAGHTPVRWRRVIDAGMVKAFAVDPLPDYADSPWRGAKSIPVAFGAADETLPLFGTRFPQCSSLLPPNSEVIDDYDCAELFEVTSKSDIAVRRADIVWAEQNLPNPTWLKIDVQGFELEVLKGFGDLLDSVQAVELETHFRPLYVGQPLIGEVTAFMDDHGFSPVHIDPQGPFGLDLIEANVFWIRRGSRDPTLDMWRALSKIPPSERNYRRQDYL